MTVAIGKRMFTTYSRLTSRIYERQHFKSMEEFVGSRTLIVCDYDNTIGKPTSFDQRRRKYSHVLGSDQWFEHRVRHHKSHNREKDAVDLALTDWFGVQCFVQAVPVEEDTPAYIRYLQEKRFMVMGLTTRSACMTIPTQNQLKSMNIDLTSSAPQKEELLFLNGHEVKYRYGMLFTSGTHKGNAFLTFLNLVSDVFQRDAFDTVLFINDKEKDLQQLQEGVDRLGKSYIGIRYSHTDEEVRTSNMEEADRQFDEMVGVLKNDNVPAAAQNKVRNDRKVG